MESQYKVIEMLLRGIDRRLDGLDGRVQVLDDRVRNLEINGAEMKGRISQLPSTWAMLTMIMGGQIALAGLLLAIMRFNLAH